MRKQNAVIQKWFFLLCWIVALGWGVSTYAQEDGAIQKELGNGISGPSDPIEQEAGVLPAASKVQIEHSPLIRKLHAARFSGDATAADRLDRQIPRPAHTGETAGEMIARPSTSVCGPGDPSLPANGNPQVDPFMGSPSITGFGNDIHVRRSNPTTKEWNQTLATDPEGNIYVAWQDDYLPKNYIQIYWSDDGGETWLHYAYISNSSADLKEPCIAVGKGPDAPRLLVTYIVDDGKNIPVPEVAIAPLGSNVFSFSSVPVWTHWEGYAKPVITTDSVTTSKWHAYLTCTGIFEGATNNINVCSWRSTDFGANWIDGQAPFGDNDDYPWLDPDISYGTPYHRVYISTYNDIDETIYCAASVDFAVSFKPPVAVHTFDQYNKPTQPVDPEIAAAINENNVMLCCTRLNSGLDTPGQAYSQDGGQTWTKLFPLHVYHTFYMYAVSLHANEGGHSWHLAYTGDRHVFYADRPQDLSDIWDAPLTPVDDAKFVSHSYTRKGITSNWKTDVAGIAWSDFREGVPDYDTYFDHSGGHSLFADAYSVSASMGGSVNLSLEAGPNNAGRQYLMLGSISGTNSGIPLPGSKEKLPLKWDLFTNIMINLLNGPLFQNFMGQLDKGGFSTATFKMLPVAGVEGLHIAFAYALNNPWNFTSNPVQILILP